MRWRYSTLLITHTTHFHVQTILLNLRLMNEPLWCTLIHTIQLTFMPTRHPSDDATLTQPAWVVFIHTEQHSNDGFCARFEILTSINQSINVFWDVMPCSLVCRNQYFAELFLLHCDRGCRFVWYITTYLQSTQHQVQEDHAYAQCPHPITSQIIANEGTVFLKKNWNNLVTIHLVPTDTVTVILLGEDKHISLDILSCWAIPMNAMPYSVVLLHFEDSK
jgi:hypothetical protein